MEKMERAIENNWGLGKDGKEKYDESFHLLMIRKWMITMEFLQDVGDKKEWWKAEKKGIWEVGRGGMLPNSYFFLDRMKN